MKFVNGIKHVNRQKNLVKNFLKLKLEKKKKLLKLKLMETMNRERKSSVEFR